MTKDNTWEDLLGMMQQAKRTEDELKKKSTEPPKDGIEALQRIHAMLGKKL